jgi:hypothetical protein
MSSPGYVWEKLYEAIDCLCKDGSFVGRLENATVSSLVELEESDLIGENAEDLIFILKWTKHNLINGKIQKEPDELERHELIGKILHVMLKTYETTL